MAEVSTRELRKAFGAVEVLHGLDLDVPDGAFAVLVGPSGCGKSTLLRMIAGLEEVTSGTVRIGERVVNHLPPSRRDIAMVFQNYALYPHKTVGANMAFALRMRRMPRPEIEERVRRAAEILGLVPYLDRYPRALSGGQRQRVAMGRAIVRDPQVFLFDEPLSNLDAQLRVQMRTEIRELHQRLGTTTIYVTHDQIEAMTMADLIVVLRAGRIEQVGTPLDLYDEPANRFVASFIGSPSMNLIPGTVRRGGVEAGGVALPVPRANGLADGARGRVRRAPRAPRPGRRRAARHGLGRGAHGRGDPRHDAARPNRCRARRRALRGGRGRLPRPPERPARPADPAAPRPRALLRVRRRDGGAARVTRTVLCFGDSNTHGTMPMAHPLDIRRHPPEARWPGVMAAALGPGWRVIEEGHPSRTTVHADPVEGAWKSGLAVLPALLESHRPLDLVVIMLGTNDLKARFSVPPFDVAIALERLLLTVAQSTAGSDLGPPDALLIAPPPIEEVGFFAEMFEGGAAKSRRLAPLLAALAERRGAGFLDAGEHAAADPEEGIHLGADGHAALGRAVAAAIRERMGSGHDARWAGGARRGAAAEGAAPTALRLEQSYAPGPGHGRLLFRLWNLRDEPLRPERLCYASMTRLSDAAEVEGGRLARRFGSHVEIAAPEGLAVAPGDAWTVALGGLTHAPENRTQGAMAAWVETADGPVPAEVGDLRPPGGERRRGRPRVPAGYGRGRRRGRGAAGARRGARPGGPARRGAARGAPALARRGRAGRDRPRGAAPPRRGDRPRALRARGRAPPAAVPGRPRPHRARPRAGRTCGPRGP